MTRKFLMFETKLDEGRQLISIKWSETDDDVNFIYDGFTEYLDSLTVEQNAIYDDFLTNRGQIVEKTIIPDANTPSYNTPE